MGVKNIFFTLETSQKFSNLGLENDQKPSYFALVNSHVQENHRLPSRPVEKR